MAFEIRNDQRTVTIEHQDDAVFDGLYAGRQAFSIFPQIHSEFYGSFTVSIGMLPQLRNELAELLADRAEKITPQLKRKYQVTARTPEILAFPIINGLLRRDKMYLKLNELIQLCDDSLNRRQPLECLGD